MNGPSDECVADLKTVVKAWQDQAADIIDIKISKFGGLTKVLSFFFYFSLFSKQSTKYKVQNFIIENQNV